MKCEFCHTEAHNYFFCHSCGKILPVCWDNWFIVFDLPMDFEIDLALLQQNYYSKLMMVHPDNFNQSGERERRLSQECGAFLNKAYNGLRQPWQRAEYMLQCLFPGYQDEQKIDDDWLMECMEWREMMECPDKLVNLMVELKRKEDDLLADMKAVLDIKDVNKGYGIISKNKFLQKFIDECSGCIARIS